MDFIVGVAKKIAVASRVKEAALAAQAAGRTVDAICGTLPPICPAPRAAAAAFPALRVNVRFAAFCVC